MDKPDKIAQILNLPVVPAQNKIIEHEEQPVNTNSDQAKQDFDIARESMLNALEAGQTALEQLSQIAVGSQHPRAFEVLAKLVDTIGETSKGLVDLHKNKQHKQVENTTVNNKLIISTTDLLKIIKSKKDENV
jgi:hypothetical protein